MRSALTAAKIFGNLKTDVKGRSASFTIAGDVDFKKKLTEIAASNKHVKGFEIQKGKGASKKKATPKKKTSDEVKGKTVSVKLPNMT